MSQSVAQTARRSVFIKKAFQGRFIASVLLMIILFGLCSAGLIYWLISGDLQSQSQSAHVNIANAWERLGLSILIGNIVAAVVAGLSAIIVVLYISHKIAGPLYRFEILCRQIGEGNLDGVTHVRENDQLQELAIAFTEMVGQLRQRRDQQQALLTELQIQLDMLGNQVESTLSGDSALINLKETLKKLENIG
jgi:methyl-accepting chemotaxis protein